MTGAQQVSHAMITSLSEAEGRTRQSALDIPMADNRR